MADILANPFKAALKAGQRQIGLWVAMADAYAAEISAGAGYDWVLLDGEHAPNDVSTLLSQLQTVAAYPTHAILRPPIGQTHLIKQYLDLGAQTLLIPMVDTAEQAEAMVRAVRYPPAGVRGVGSAIARSARWNRIPNYLTRANDEICLLVQVETKQGLDNIDAIAAVEGVDGVFIGPSDLSAALGHIGQITHPEVQAAIEDAFRRIRAADKAPGILMADEALIRRYIELGCLFIAVGTDVSILARGAEALATKWKGESAAAPVAKGTAY